MDKGIIYLDHAATTYVKPEVFEAMKPWFTEYYGNPSAIYSLGRQSKKAIEEARAQIAYCLGAHPTEIFSPVRAPKLIIGRLKEQLLQTRKRVSM